MQNEKDISLYIDIDICIDINICIDIYQELIEQCQQKSWELQGLCRRVVVQSPSKKRPSGDSKG